MPVASASSFCVIGSSHLWSSASPTARMRTTISRDPSVSLAAPNVRHPLPEYRSFDQGLPPECGRDPRKPVAEFPDGFMLDKPERARRDGADAGIESLQVAALKFRPLPGDVDRHAL